MSAMDVGKKGAGEMRPASDPAYNLISVLYHALKGADLYDEYIADAEAAGDMELRDFFFDVRKEEASRADKARELLAARLESEWQVSESDIEKAAE